MADPVRLLFFAGSARRDSFNKKLARLGVCLAEEREINATFLDLADYPLPLYDGDLEGREGVPEMARKLKVQLALNDGIFIASPEYNSAITPLLKNTLDWVSRIRDEGEVPNAIYKKSIFAIGGASPGVFGGMRALMGVRQYLSIGLGAMVIPGQIAVAKAHQAFDEEGDLKDHHVRDMYSVLVSQLAIIAARQKTPIE